MSALDDFKTEVERLAAKYLTGGLAGDITIAREVYDDLHGSLTNAVAALTGTVAKLEALLPQTVAEVKDAVTGETPAETAAAPDVSPPGQVHLPG